MGEKKEIEKFEGRRGGGGVRLCVCMALALMRVFLGVFFVFAAL